MNCPACNTPIRGVTTSGPSIHVIRPCGHRATLQVRQAFMHRVVTDGGTDVDGTDRFGPADVICPYCGDTFHVTAGPTKICKVTHCNDRWIVVDLEAEEYIVAFDGNGDIHGISTEDYAAREVAIKTGCGMRIGVTAYETAEEMAVKNPESVGKFITSQMTADDILEAIR